MSERQEHKKRYNLRLQYINAFDKWLHDVPLMWKVFSWHKWKLDRPTSKLDFYVTRELTQ